MADRKAADSSRYITLDSAAFAEKFPNNTGLDFCNLLNPPIDNSEYNLEIALLGLAVKGSENTIHKVFNVSCDLVDPFQSGSGTSQAIYTFLMRRKMSTVQMPMDNNYYYIGLPFYYPLRETHTNFDTHTSVRIRLMDLFEWTEADQAYTRDQLNYQLSPTVDVKRIVINLHIRKKSEVDTPVTSVTSTLANKEATRLYLI
jgi:hypothetical protein